MASRHPIEYMHRYGTGPGTFSLAMQRQYNFQRSVELCLMMRNAMPLRDITRAWYRTGFAELYEGHAFIPDEIYFWGS